MACTFKLKPDHQHHQSSSIADLGSRFVGTLWGFEFLPQIFTVYFGIAAEFEDDETDGSLSENEHSVSQVDGRS